MRIAHPVGRMKRDRKCSYVVLLERAAGSAGELRELARYLTTLDLAGCEVVVLDPSPLVLFDANRRTLRWVSRHLQVPSVPADLARCASAVAACEKVIVATEDVRYTPEAVARLCDLLEMHEVVEPQDYLDPLPWWSGIDAGRILIHRGIEPQPDHGATFGFRRGASMWVPLPSAAPATAEGSGRHIAPRALAFPAADVFVQRRPRAFREWLAQRPRLAGEDFDLPVKTAFFLSTLPLLLLLAVAGGLQLASGYAGAIAFASLALAVRGRAGASSFFPLRACFFAPLWVFERSVSVYWALLLKLTAQQSTRSVPESSLSARTTSPYSQHNRAQ